LRREKMEVIAIDLLLLNGLDEVASKNHISPATLYKLRKNDDFKDILYEQKRRIFSEASSKMQGYTLEAVEALMSIIRSTHTQDANRINAIRILLDNSKGAYEREEVLPKLEELEKQISLLEGE
jgi:hypothetical protein